MKRILSLSDFFSNLKRILSCKTLVRRNCLGPKQFQLSRRILSLWGYFSSSGRPNAGLRGLPRPPWPALAVGAGRVCAPQLSPPQAERDALVARPRRHVTRNARAEASARLPYPRVEMQRSVDRERLFAPAAWARHADEARAPRLHGEEQHSVASIAFVSVAAAAKQKKSKTKNSFHDVEAGILLLRILLSGAANNSDPNNSFHDARP